MASQTNGSVGKSRKFLVAAGVAAVACSMGIGFFRTRHAEAQNLPARQATGEYVQAESAERAGKYLVATAGCNDCHTPGWMERGQAVAEEQWLTGVPIGWRGPWGTTYASNLRLFVQDFSEDLFVQTVRARNSRPPMPWQNLHSMSDSDLRAIYRYIRSLPVRGEKMPEYCPPGVEPKTPYMIMQPQMPGGGQS